MKITLSRKSVSELLFFTALFAACLILAFRLSFKDGKPRGAGVFASDKSIYYAYLPATFIYGWDARKFPNRCDTIYKGFVLDEKSGKVINKMTCGVAILWTPFFLATHAAVKILHLRPDGFSSPYQEMAVVPPVFFLVLGLFFLKRFLEACFPRGMVCLSLLLLLAGTNLYYYGLAEGLMSHVHSFFLFALYLFLLRKFIGSGKQSYPLFVAIAVVVSMAVLVRPTNIIILGWFFLLDAKGGEEIWARITAFFRPQFLFTFLSVAFLVFLPQFIYWKYVSGSFLHYSYGGEGFFYWRNPVILPLLFSPFNGLFLYNPLLLFFAAGTAWMIIRRKPNGLLLLFTFALVTYISGSWHMWFFGGSYGSRPFVEYYALFTIGFCHILNETARLRNLFARLLVMVLMVIFSYYNLRLIYHPTWYTGSVWDWDSYKTRLDQAGILHFSKETYTWINDCENISFEPAVVKSNLACRSQNLSAMVDSRYEYCGIYNHPMTGILDHNVNRITATLWINPVARPLLNTVLVASVEDGSHHPWFYKRIPLNQPGSKAGGWSEVTMSFPVPLWLNEPGSRVSFYIWNLDRRTFFMDDIRIKFE